MPFYTINFIYLYRFGQKIFCPRTFLPKCSYGRILRLQRFLMMPSKSTREGLLMKPLLYVISITIHLIITGYKALSRYNEHKYKIILHVAIWKKAIAWWTVLNSQLLSGACVWREIRFDKRFARLFAFWIYI